MQNYRPVSNFAFMAKVVEKLVCHQLVALFERHQLLPSVQSAYRKKHSTLSRDKVARQNRVIKLQV